MIYISKRIFDSLFSISTNLIYVLSLMNLYANLCALSLLYSKRNDSSVPHQNFIFHLKRGSHDIFVCAPSLIFFFPLAETPSSSSESPIKPPCTFLTPNLFLFSLFFPYLFQSFFFPL